MLATHCWMHLACFWILDLLKSSALLPQFWHSDRAKAVDVSSNANGEIVRCPTCRMAQRRSTLQVMSKSEHQAWWNDGNIEDKSTAKLKQYLNRSVTPNLLALAFHKRLL